jgi:hypothetical protein
MRLLSGHGKRSFYPDGGNKNDEYGFAYSESLVATIKMY